MAQNDDTFVTDEVEAVLTRGPAKKAAAKKTASKPQAKAYDGPEWPYGDDEYLYEEVVSRRGHSEPKYVAAVQQALDLPADGIYDARTNNAVAEYQKANGLATTGVVDRATWESLLG